MQRALAAYQGGNWAEAERLCQLVLKTDTNNFDALNMLGAIAAQTRRTQQAVEFLGRAIAVDSSNAETYYNRGVVLRKWYVTSCASASRLHDLEPIGLHDIILGFRRAA